jgi:hypothetical protein
MRRGELATLAKKQNQMLWLTQSTAIAPPWASQHHPIHREARKDAEEVNIKVKGYFDRMDRM